MLRWFLFLILWSYAMACLRQPSVYHSKVAKLKGDNGYKIKLQDDLQKYVPGEVYTVHILGTRTFGNIQYFQRFMLNIESVKEPGNISPQKVGSFQLFGDNLSKFNEDCVNTISETNNLPKTEVSFIWKAPPTGSGCVTFRAMVLEDFTHWYADEGALNKTICEITDNDRKLDDDDCCACDEAKYNLIFEGLWSNITHPKDFPFSLWLTHFSDVIGASHERNYSFWDVGQIATDGFRSLAEWGSVRLLESEIRAKSKYLRSIIKSVGLWYPKVNTNVSTTFKVDRKHHLVSMASMLGPSPDWVVGVSGLNLCLKNCTWIEDLAVDLFPYDAGTDNGISYMSANDETNPRERIYRITTKYPEDPRAPFYDANKDEMPPLARFYFHREKLIPKGCDESFLTAQLDVSENTEDTSRPECAVTEYTNWSPCSVTCGKGLSMRTRQYLMPQKAQMLQCNRQLISKEMCVADIPECQGENNEVDSEEKIEDNEGICATSVWSSWSECSATCGVGFISRTRHFIDHMGRKKCPHVNIFEREKCMGPTCVAEEAEVPDPMCPVTEWSDWSPCSASCGKGVKLRTRLLLVEPGLQEKCSSRVEMVQQRPCVDTPDCSFDAATAKEVCMQESVQGPCTGHFNRWYFESNKLMCVPFVYGGCRGNRNNFLTIEECTESCKVVRDGLLRNRGGETEQKPGLSGNSQPFDMATAKEVCMEESSQGPCRKSLDRWYFHNRKLMCVPFIYGGCQGNKNNFLRFEDCNNACSVVRDALTGVTSQTTPAPTPPLIEPDFDMATAKEVCMQKTDSGPCSGNLNRWYFEQRKLMCVPFTYGGCQGNKNNFITADKCNKACKVVRDILSASGPSIPLPIDPSPSGISKGSGPFDMATAKTICMEESSQGPCRDSLDRWYFHNRKLMCVPFIYGGCQGNKNNFLTFEDCNNACAVVRDALTGTSSQSNPPPVVPNNERFDMATAKEVCMQESDSGSCTGNLNRWYFDQRKLMCVPFPYGGCQGNRNNFVTAEKCTTACKVVRDILSANNLPSVPTNSGVSKSKKPLDMATAKAICMQEHQEGTCFRNLNRWYFEPRKLMCVPFVYGGCQGNENNFETADECNSVCQVVRDALTGTPPGKVFPEPNSIEPQFDMATAKEVCMQESLPGPCNGNQNRWYFEQRKLMCVPFIYGGCRGNRNNFETADQCNQACKVVRDLLLGNNPNNLPISVTPSVPAVSRSKRPIDMATAKSICMQNLQEGPCDGHFNRWYFESRKLMCVPFVYGGCQGNENNFETAEECNAVCKVVRDAISGNPNSPQQTDVNSVASDMATSKRICMQESEPGSCRNSLQRYYFDTRKLMCVPFIYSGCNGNSNNFFTVEECTRTCKIVREALTGNIDSVPVRNPQPSSFGNHNAVVDCVLSDWSDWTDCSASCGIGYNVKSRKIIRQSANGGVPCPRRLQRKQKCNIRPCN